MSHVILRRRAQNTTRWRFLDNRAQIKQIAIIGPNADNGPMNAGSYVKVGTKLTTFLAAAPSNVPKDVKIISAALNSTVLIDGGHKAPNAGGDPANNNHNPNIPGGIDMNVLTPEQRRMIDDAVRKRYLFPTARAVM
jgi:hypothetical protein